LRTDASLRETIFYLEASATRTWTNERMLNEHVHVS